MARINRVPWGLQSLLSAKNFGVNPSELVESVQPVLEMEPFLNYELIRTTGALGTFTAVGQTVEILVPANEAWKLLAFHGDVQNVDATERFYCVIEVLPKNADTTSYVYLGSKTKDVNNADQTGYAIIANMPQPFLIGAGSSLRMRLIDGNPTSINAGITVMYERYET